MDPEISGAPAARTNKARVKMKRMIRAFLAILLEATKRLVFNVFMIVSNRF
jgi:hypothetical protein